jgi:hypothetical protein
MAALPKKGGATPDDIMTPAAIKPLLALSKREPVSAAVGVTADKLGVLLLHKMMKPKKVLAQLRAEAKKVQLVLDSPSLRFGTAEVNPEIDSALAVPDQQGSTGDARGEAARASEEDGVFEGRVRCRSRPGG